MLAACACFLIAGPATAAGPPVVATGGVSTITATSAALEGNVNPEGQATTYYFEYGTTTAYGSTAPVPPAGAGSGTAGHFVSAPVTSLAPSTLYHYALVANNASGPAVGIDATFTTKGAPPVVSTGGVSGVTTTAATLTGTVNPQGQATTYTFEYGPSTAYGSTAPAPPADAGAGGTDVSASVAVASLATGATYHYRLDATNASGTMHGADRSFTTKGSAPASSAPEATTGGATAVTATSVTLAGTVNPMGQVTIVDFQYGTSKAYGSTATSSPGNAGAGSVSVKVSAGLTSLAPETTYHYRLVATSALGTTYGSDRSFKTKKAPAITISASPIPIVFGQKVAVSGAVIGVDAAHTSVALQVSGSARGRFVTVATTTAGSKGVYSFPKRVLRSRTYIRTQALGLRSGTLLVPVRFHVTLGVSTKHPARGIRVRFHGHVATGRSHMRIQIQRIGSRGRWHTVARTRLHRGRRGVWSYSVSLLLSRSGRYRAIAGPRAGYDRGYSQTIRIRVR